MKKNINIWRRALATCLALLLCLAMMPTSALAAGTDQNASGNQTTPAESPTSGTGDTTSQAPASITIDETNFPDKNFREYISSRDQGETKDGILNAEEIAAISKEGINCSGLSILSLKGIELFTGLMSLDCSGNKLTSLDLSKNTALTSINCSNNQLTTLTLPSVTVSEEKNTTLNYLNCSNNQLTSLNLEKYSGIAPEDGETASGLVADNNIRYILLKAPNNSITLSVNLGITDTAKITNKTMDNCSVIADSPNSLKITTESKPATYTYTYACGNGHNVDFTVKFAIANKAELDTIYLDVDNETAPEGDGRNVTSGASFQTYNQLALTGTGELSIDTVANMESTTEVYDNIIEYHVSIPALASSNTVTGTLTVPAPRNYDPSTVSVVASDGISPILTLPASNSTTLALHLSLKRSATDKVANNQDEFEFDFLVKYNTISYSSGGSSSRTPATTVTNSTQTTTAGETETITTAKVTAKTTTNSDKSGMTTVDVDDTTANKIIAKAVENKSEEVVIDATNSAGTADLQTGSTTEVKLSENLFTEMSEKTGASLTLKTNTSTMTLDSKAVEAISDQNSSSAEASKSDQAVTLVQKIENIQGREIQLVSLNLYDSSKNEIHNLGGGTLTCTINSNISKKDSLKCLYVSEDNTYSIMPILQTKQVNNHTFTKINDLTSCIEDFIKINNTINNINNKIIFRDKNNITNINYINNKINNYKIIEPATIYNSLKYENKTITNINYIENKDIILNDITVNEDIKLIDEQIYLQAIKIVVEQLKSSIKDGDEGITLLTNHLSDFAIMDSDVADDLIADQESDAAKIIKGLTLKTRSQKTKSGSVKVTASVDKDDIKALTDLGYTVRYRFYRSTKKSSGYQPKLEGTGKTYTNTSGKDDTRYYYKVQVRVYDNYGDLVAKSALKQCKYATRVFS